MHIISFLCGLFWEFPYYLKWSVLLFEKLVGTPLFKTSVEITTTVETLKVKISPLYKFEKLKT